MASRRFNTSHSEHAVTKFRRPTPFPDSNVRAGAKAVISDGKGQEWAWPTVLVAADEPPVRALLRSLLVRQGYRVVEAEDGAAAYEVLQQQSGDIQLLVTDVKMPRMDGFTLGKKVSVEYPNIKVLYISGFVPAPAEHHIPASRFLQKPFNPDALVRCVQRLLRLSSP